MFRIFFALITVRMTAISSFLFSLSLLIFISGCEDTTSFEDRHDGGREKASASNLWSSTQEIQSYNLVESNNEIVSGLKLQVANNGHAFVTWKIMSDSEEQIKVMRGVGAEPPELNWTSPEDQRYRPVGYNSTSTAPDFVLNKAKADGYSFWMQGDTVMASDYMTAMGHFMFNSSLGEGHVPQVLVALHDDDTPYMVLQSHMMNGFGLDVRKNTALNTWSAPVQLHRMGMDAANAITMPNHFLKTGIDGSNNIMAVWLEEQAGTTRLMSSIYNTSMDMWGGVSTIVDSTNTHGVDLANLVSVGFSGENFSTGASLVLYQDNNGDKAVFTIDKSSSWQMPMRRDMQTDMKKITSDVSYATNAHGHLVATWVEHDAMMTMDMVKALRFVPGGDGWQDVAQVVMTEMDVTAGNLAIALSHDGGAAVVWVENSGTQRKLAFSSQLPGSDWTAKEVIQLIEEEDMATMIHTPSIVLLDGGIPWIVWNTETPGEGVSHIITNLVLRLKTINGESGGGGGGGGEEPPPGDVSERPSVSEHWDVIKEVATGSADPSTNPMVSNTQLQIAGNGDAFINWSIVSDTSESINVMRATAASEYQWQGPGSSDMTFIPAGISATSTGIQFTVNKGTGDGYALWSDDNVLHISEYMSGMSHFMTTAEVGEGHTPDILVASHDSNDAYLVTQSHMMNGFGLDVRKRVEAGNWTLPVQLHRMGMDVANAIEMPNHFLQATMDGMDNILAIWLETQAGTTRLMSAVYDTGTDTWASPVTIIDSDNIHGVDLVSLVSMAFASTDASMNISLVLYQNNTDGKAVFTMNMDDTGWQMPVRRDMQTETTMITSDLVYASNAHGHLAAVWVEHGPMMGSAMTMDMLMSLRYTPGTGWGSMEQAGMAAMDVSISKMGLSLNHGGHALATWVETSSTGKEILSSTQVLGQSWSDREVIDSVMAHDMVNTPSGVFADDGTPWIAWVSENTHEGMTMYTTNVVMRSMVVSGAEPPADPAPGDGGSGGGGSGGDGGTGGGGTGGGGSGGGGGTGGDGGTGGTGALPGLWDAPEDVNSTGIATVDGAIILSPQVQLAGNGSVYTNWVTGSLFNNETQMFTNLNINIVRGALDQATYTWGSSGTPTGYTTDAMDTQFFVHPSMDMGFATWNAAGSTFVSELMLMEGMPPHFMGNAELSEGHATQVLIDSTGQAYLIMQTHMMGGFGLTIYKRTGMNQWTAMTNQVHRMDMTNPVNLFDHNLIAAMDGQDNIHAVWVEEQLAAFTLQSSIFNTTDETWSTVASIHAHEMTLNKVIGGQLSLIPGGASMNLVLTQQDGMMYSIFNAGYTDSAGWSMPMKWALSDASAMIMKPLAMTSGADGGVTVAWIEMVTGMADMIMARRFVPGDTADAGWQAAEMVGHAGASSEASSINVAMNGTGDASVTWIESTASGSDIIASHKVDTNQAWSQKELILPVNDTDGAIDAVDTGIDSQNKTITLVAIKQSDGETDTFTIKRVIRTTAIADAQTGGTGPVPNEDPPADDPTPGPQPVTVNWTTPVLAVEMMHSTTNMRFYGPQIVLDDVGGSAIRMSMANISGTSVSSIGNHIVRSADNSAWSDTLMNSGVLSDLSNSALFLTINVIPTTGNLYGLIRDDGKLYLARYVADTGWQKQEIPEVPADIPRRNMQLTTNDTGMVTVIWHEVASENIMMNIHAKHFMASGGWRDTDTLQVPAETVLTPHVVENNGVVHAAWLVAEGSGFNAKMATYTPMVGWSEVMAGPTNLKKATAEIGSNGAHQIIVVTDAESNEISASVSDHEGNWASFTNINKDVKDDNIKLKWRTDTQIISGGAHQFMVAWREWVTNSSGIEEIRYRTVTLHQMTDANGMAMWHVSDPSQVGGMNTEIESNLQYAMDSEGNSYAVWTSVDVANSTSNVYVNRALAGGPWEDMPELLASYDTGAGNYAHGVSIAINTEDNVAISWDNHESNSSMSMHRVWFVVKDTGG